MMPAEIDQAYERVVSAGERRRRIRRLASAGVISAAVLGGVLATTALGPDRPDSVVTDRGPTVPSSDRSPDDTDGQPTPSTPAGDTSASTTATDPTVDPEEVSSDRGTFTASLPSDWVVSADQYPAANEVDPGFESLTVATFAAPATMSLSCALPLGALEGMGPSDAVLSVQTASASSAFSATRPPGRELVPIAPPESALARCLDREPADLLVHYDGYVAPNGRQYEVLVVTGMDPSSETIAAIEEIVDSLEVTR